ncbi:MAG: hypothetical protein ABR887_05875 [Methanoregulaceae archaeon]|jgi:hypothetical protein
MSTTLRIIGYIFVLSLVTIASAASNTNTGTTSLVITGSSTGGQNLASLVYVSSVTIDPQVYYPHETGYIDVQLTNVGNQSIALDVPGLIETHVHIQNSNAFSANLNIAPGSTMDLPFLISVDGPDGTYYPTFSVGTKQGNSINYPIKIEVDSTDIKASISQKPDNFALSTTNTVNLSIVNPRDGDIKNVIITPEGQGVIISPATSFISVISAGSDAEIPFDVTPYQETNVTFHVSFQNGQNKHTTDVVLPLNLGEDKTAAKPVLNDIAVVSQGSSYQLTGDVTNAGITGAQGMVLTVLAPAKPVEPYSEYPIGTLASDDFSSFTLTFVTDDLSSVPVQIQWKNANGNTFNVTKNLDLRTNSGSGSTVTVTRTGSTSSSGSTAGQTGTSASAARAGGGAPGGGGIFGFSGNRGGGLSSFYPVIASGIIVIIAIVLWMKRKWLKSKLKKR